MKYLKVTGLSFLLLIMIALSLRAMIFTPSIWLEPIANSQTFDMAVHISKVPDMKDHYLVTEKSGKIFLVKEGSVTKKTILDLHEKVKSDTTEEGMLSAQIDPQNLDTIYVYYSLDNPLTNHLSRFRMDQDKNVIVESEELLINIPQPHTGHNGGDMKFGPDGYLWISIGEASYAAKGKSSELDSSIPGTILRIDVRNHGQNKNYAIPSDNPFVNNPSIPDEVWARGFRNPWRWSFIDDQTVIVGDVGDSTFEEVSIIKKGEHAGWPYVEGLQCSRYYPKCDQSKYKAPMTAFDRAVSRSVTGGLMYRGDKISQLKGKYVFADYLRGIMTLPSKDAPKRVKQVYDSGYKIIFPKIPMSFGPNKGTTLHPVSFLEDDNKEILVVTLNGGVYRIVDINLWTKLRGFLYMFGSFR